MKLTDAQKEKTKADKDGKFESFFSATPIQQFQVDCTCGFSGVTTSKACPKCEPDTNCTESTEVKGGE